MLKKAMFLKVSSVLLTGIIFVGCSFKAEALNPNEYNQYSVLYEVNYDLECTYGGFTMIFKKGDKFGPMDVGGYGFYGGDEGRLPKSTIAIPVRSTPLMTQFTLIFPDGSFASNYHLASLSSGNSNLFLAPDSVNACKIKNNKPLFKQVNNDQSN